MEPLQELVLSIVYPTSSWGSFLESLAAEPSAGDWPKWYDTYETMVQMLVQVLITVVMVLKI
jgi:hypothetical protein